MSATYSSIPFHRWLAVPVLMLTLPAVQAASSWQINPAGTGVAGASAVTAVDVGGVGFVQIQPDVTNPAAFVFVEHGAYQVLQADQVTPFGSQDLTVTYSITGNGSLFDPTALRFTAGTIDMFVDPVFDFASAAGAYGADNGTRIASFEVFDGGLSSAGLVTLSARLIAGSLAGGYLFSASGDDLASRSGVFLTLGVFNERDASPDALLVSEIACDMASYGGPGCNGASYVDSPFAYAVRDGGFATISAVPEPATTGMLLAGLGVLGAKVRRRRVS